MLVDFEMFFEVFNSILPPFLVKRILRNPSHAIGDRVDRVSILFILLCDFEKHSMTMSPVKLFRFLNAFRLNSFHPHLNAFTELTPPLFLSLLSLFEPLNAFKSLFFRSFKDTFVEIDVVCATHGVTKIETVGEEYVCGVGVSPTDQDEDHITGHTGCLNRLLLVAWELQNLPRNHLSSAAPWLSFG